MNLTWKPRPKKSQLTKRKMKPTASNIQQRLSKAIPRPLSLCPLTQRTTFRSIRCLWKQHKSWRKPLRIQMRFRQSLPHQHPTSSPTSKRWKKWSNLLSRLRRLLMRLRRLRRKWRKRRKRSLWLLRSLRSLKSLRSRMRLLRKRLDSPEGTEEEIPENTDHCADPIFDVPLIGHFLHFCSLETFQILTKTLLLL